MIDGVDYFPGLLALIVLMAALYSTVGHGGASGYLAAMALFGLAPETMKPAALAMNVFVTVFVLSRLVPRQDFMWRLFVPLAVASMPMAFIGGAWQLNAVAYQSIVGVVLLFSAAQLLINKRLQQDVTLPYRLWLVLPVGGVLGLLSGLTGVGGGIFLSPLLLFLRWTTMRSNVAIAAAFILVNSLAGLAGFASNTSSAWSDGTAWLIAAAVVGAVIGAGFAAHRLQQVTLRKVLAVVLVIAAVKMIVNAW